MSNNNLLPFNLEVALKHPEMVVFRNGKKPLDWHYFDKAVNNDYPIISVTTDGDICYSTKGGSYHKYEDDEHPLDLMLLPEFTPEEGKWYWAKYRKDSDFQPRYYSKGCYWSSGIRYNPSELHTIHPEPINPPE
jgi:hypothetical protein